MPKLKNFRERCRNRPFSRDRVKILELTIRDNHRPEKAIGEKTIDTKIMVLEMTLEKEAEGE